METFDALWSVQEKPCYTLQLNVYVLFDAIIFNHVDFHPSMCIPGVILA